MKRIFISSVQKEFEKERAAIKQMIENDPFVRAHYDAFVFEIDAPATDKSTQQVYLSEVEKSDVYLLLIGDRYGFEDADGVSPTEREYNRAVERGLPILVFVKGSDGSCRDAKECRFLDKVSSGRTRVRFQPMNDPRDLLNEVRGSIRELMMDEGLLSELPFEDQQPHDTTLDDIDDSRIAWFVKNAVRMRSAPFAEGAEKADVLRSLKLLNRKTGQPTKAAVLLFGKDPQYLFPTSCIKCASYFGTEKRKPNEDLEIYDGDLFRLSDQAVAFVNRHIFHGVGAHNHGSAADDLDEIPNNVITEAINNAIAHRNYASNGSIQVEVYQDRIEVISPGRLMSPLTIDMLYGKHESVAPNPHIARAMFWVKYIETVGTGLNDLLDSCAAAGLKKPTFEANNLHFRIIIWRHDIKLQINANKNDAKMPNDDEVVAFIVNNASLSVKDIANKLQIKLGVMRSTIARLKREKGLAHVGSRKTGHWAFQHKVFGFDAARGAGLEAEVAPTLTTAPSACVLSVNHKSANKRKDS